MRSLTRGILSSLMPAEKALEAADRMEADAMEWYSKEAVRSRTTEYWDKVAELDRAARPLSPSDIQKIYNDVFVGWRMLYPGGRQEWQEYVIDCWCAIHLNTPAPEGFDKGKKGLLVVGPTGVGKTAVFEYLKSLRGVFTFRMESALSIKKGTEVSGSSYTAPLERCKTLVIDDIGTEGQIMYMGNVISPIQQIVHIRYERNLSTTVTMNYGAHNAYDARVIDRLKGMCNVVKIGKETASLR